MKQIWNELAGAVVLGLILPAFILSVAVRFAPTMEDAKETEVIEMRESVMIPVIFEDGSVRNMELDDYLTGVVLAEMPASFELEALKAQAVVARTYTLRAHGGKSKHPQGSVCTDSACCQAYRNPEGYPDPEGLGKVSSAVLATSGLVLTYEGELIEATYFSCSGGSTEDAVAVWGTDVPYLRATVSPGEENATYYTDSATYSAPEIQALLGQTLSGSPESWFGAVSYTAGGGVEEMTIGDESYTGTELRKLLGLRSTAFTVTTDADSITFHTRGFGHRVGMSQYGADAMAATGSDFREILQHYYQGVELELLNN